ncbi:cupin domain-containing protein [Halopenitus persicus]|uniref:cupin domain-containing protein n=1 Tax=Halopenitus persicus TaxID=1048396 RepID=UPI000BBB1091|nr:cupin domain-containing protein [Halopenitus persicus]
MEPVNEADLEWSELDRDDAMFRRKQLGEAAGGEELGCSLYELPPGERSWPYHYHAANEEALYVLAGTGSLRVNGGTHRLEAGDYAAFPADETGGHRVINDGDGVLRYLMVSTMRDPDVTVYPDRDRIGVYVGSPPGSRDRRSVQGYYAIDDEVDYWAGSDAEPDGSRSE